MSTASSTPRRFPPVSPGLRGLTSTAEEDILDLFDEHEEREDHAVQMEIQGLMTNIHMELGLDGMSKFFSSRVPSAESLDIMDGMSSCRSGGWRATSASSLEG